MINRSNRSSSLVSLKSCLSRSIRVRNHAGHAIVRHEHDVQGEGADETSVHAPVFLDKRNATMKSLEAM